MKMVSMKIKNFRGYKDEVAILFNDLTAFVGKNDIGKSSILEALDIFYNDGKGSIKLDKDDINKVMALEDNRETIISVCFAELPDTLVIDATNATSLQAEYLIKADNQLEIIKRYQNGGPFKVYINAVHPTNPECKDLLLKKDSELRSILDEKGIGCDDRVRKARMRAAIWNHYATDLQFAEIELDVTKGDIKTIWDKIQQYLPIYTLFQSDRKNCDGDSEVQDPLKEAVKEILNNTELRELLSTVANEVDRKLREVSGRTLEKLRELNPEIARNLNPRFPPVESLKWADVFKGVSIAGDEDIPVNKRGSGTKRLILLSFFRAEAEHRTIEHGNTGIIYAIEEPETSQHTENQKILVNSFKNLSQLPNTQIIMTTHSANVVKELDFANLRLISMIEGRINVSSVVREQLPYPSLNEVNYSAFTEVSEEYHNELYGYIEAEGKKAEYVFNKPTLVYIKINNNNNNQQTCHLTLTEYIRNQIHHPENRLNDRFTPVQLLESIEMMRHFIETLHV